MMKVLHSFYNVNPLEPKLDTLSFTVKGIVIDNKSPLIQMIVTVGGVDEKLHAEVMLQDHLTEINENLIESLAIELYERAVVLLDAHYYSATNQRLSVPTASEVIPMLQIEQRTA